MGRSEQKREEPPRGGFGKGRMRLKHRKNRKLHFHEDGPVRYHGECYVSQFSIGTINQSISNEDDKAAFNFTIAMARNFRNQILTTFVPSFVLWLFGYSTLFIDPDESLFRTRSFLDRVAISVQ